MSDQSFSDHMSDEPLFIDVSTSERQWAMFAHLSALVAIWMGGLGFLGPLIVWLIYSGFARCRDLWSGGGLFCHWTHDAPGFRIVLGLGCVCKLHLSRSNLSSRITLTVCDNLLLGGGIRCA